VVGYSLSAPTQRLRAVFSEEVSALPLSTAEITTESVVATPLGAERVHRDQFQERYTLGQVDLTVAVEVMKRFAGDNTQTRADRLPEIVQVVRAWREEGWLRCADGIVPQHLMIQELSQRAAECVLGSIQVAHADESVVLPVFGVPRELSTDDVSFVTVKPVWETRDDRCALTHVVADTDSWEQKVAQCLEDMPEVVAYVKNERLGFTIPYVMDGIVRRYLPDFIAKVDDGNGHGDLLHVVIEVTGQKRSSKRVKVATALATWIPALQSARRTGQGIARWSFVEVDDVTETVSTLRAHLHHVRAHTVERLAMHRLLQFMPEVLVDPEELDAVHTYDGEGRPLTLRAWIAQEVQGIAPVAARALSRKLSRPRAPDEIDDDLMGPTRGANAPQRPARSCHHDRRTRLLHPRAACLGDQATHRPRAATDRRHPAPCGLSRRGRAPRKTPRTQEPAGGSLAMATVLRVDHNADVVTTYFRGRPQPSRLQHPRGSAPHGHPLRRRTGRVRLRSTAPEPLRRRSRARRGPWAARPLRGPRRQPHLVVHPQPRRPRRNGGAPARL
jgi:hypothetical protein